MVNAFLTDVILYWGCVFLMHRSGVPDALAFAFLSGAGKWCLF